MVINPLLSENEVKKERTVILEEAKMYKDLPQSYVHELLDELLWPAQPLGMSIIGTPESISRINRPELALYQKKYYTPLNIVISTCGNIAYDKFVKRADKIFGSLSQKSTNAFSKVEEKQDKPQLKLFAKDTEQTHLAMGFHALRRGHPLRHALAMLHIILGANMSSRLFNEVREKRGLAYEIGTQVKRFHDTGSFLVHAGIDNGKVGQAIVVILKELSRIKSELVTVDEFRRSKDFYLGQLVLALEDTLDHMLWIGESTTCLDKTYSLKEIVKEVNGIKREEIRQVARGIFKDSKTNLALIGPLKDSESQIYNQLSIS
jgi:predicted Zn-dependent peptidase